MTDNIKEEISALVDGELDAAGYEALRDALRDDEYRQSWHRYHLISDAMKQQMPDTLNHDLFQRVHAVLESEPLILSPQAQQAPAKSQSAPGNPEAHQESSPSRWWGRSAIGLSVAASVAVVAVAATQLLTGQDELAVPAVASNEPAQATPVAVPPAVETAQPNAVAGIEDSLMSAPPAMVLPEHGLAGDEQWKRLDMFDPPQASPYQPEGKEFSLIPGLRPHAQVVRFGEQPQETQ